MFINYTYAIHVCLWYGIYFGYTHDMIIIVSGVLVAAIACAYFEYIEMQYRINYFLLHEKLGINFSVPLP